MKVQALYTVKQLAEMGDIPEQTLRDWIKREGMTLFRVGRSVRVPMTSFRDTFPQIWAAIVSKHSLKKDAKCPVCQGAVALAEPVRLSPNSPSPTST